MSNFVLLDVRRWVFLLSPKAVNKSCYGSDGYIGSWKTAFMEKKCKQKAQMGYLIWLWFAPGAKIDTLLKFFLEIQQNI
jgi:hypothetical protein